MKKNVSITIIAIIIVAVVCVFAAWKSHPSAPVTFTPVPIAISLQDSYTVKNGKVYWVTLSPKIIDNEVLGADSATFVPLDNGWGKDATHIFYDGYMTEPMDASVPTIHTSSFTSIPDTFYAKDDQAVYFPTFVNGQNGTGTYKYSVFPGADPNTFVIVEPEMYAKDKNNVWLITPGEGGPAREKIVGANPADCTADNLKGCEAQ